MRPGLAPLLQQYPPALVTAPVATGTVVVGNVLSTTDGVWRDAESFAYQWYRAGVAIGGATASTHVVVAATSNALEFGWSAAFGADLQASFDARDGDTFTPANPANGQSVETWADQSGHAHDVTQPNPALRGTFLTGVVDGNPGVQVWGAASLENTVLDPIAQGAPCAVFMVWKGVDTNGGAGFTLRRSADYLEATVIPAFGPANIYYMISDGQASTVAFAQADITDSHYQIWQFPATGGNPSTSIDGTARADTTTGTRQDQTGAQGFVLGSNGSHFGIGVLMEARLVDRLMTSNEVATVNAYAAYRYPSI